MTSIQKPPSLGISIWKKALLIAFLCFFVLTFFKYATGGIDENAGWLWPMLFVPLILYLLGVFYGDVPSNFLNPKRLRPFPVSFSRQYDRSVVALIVLFTGLFFNCILLAAAFMFSDALFLKALYALYTLLMIYELPNSLKIFRFIQHVNTMQYINALNPETFKRATEYYKPEQFALEGEMRKEYLRTLHESLLQEAISLVQKESPLPEVQQVTLNLAVRSGEALQRSRLALAEKDIPRLRANILILKALETNANLEVPSDFAHLKLSAEKMSKESPAA